VPGHPSRELELKDSAKHEAKGGGETAYGGNHEDGEREQREQQAKYVLLVF